MENSNIEIMRKIQFSSTFNPDLKENYSYVQQHKPSAGYCIHGIKRTHRVQPTPDFHPLDTVHPALYSTIQSVENNNSRSSKDLIKIEAAL
jgi:hypothetical protein